jgi:hypothetical protein
VLEEFPDLWDPENPALQMVKAIGAGGPISLRPAVASLPTCASA